MNFILTDLCYQGDIPAIKKMIAKGIQIDVADYDGRTPLHLACSEGHNDLIEYFFGKCKIGACWLHFIIWKKRKQNNRKYAGQESNCPFPF